MMRKGGRSLVTALVLMVPAFATVGFVAVDEVLGYTVRMPIAINCDTCFTPSNGVTGGSGSSVDPYVIEGWEIDSSQAVGITIRDTSVHFMIRDVYIHAGPADIQHGMFLQRVANGLIEDVLVEGTDIGVYLSEASNITIVGIHVVRSRGAAIGSVGGDVTIRNSVVRDSGTGLYLNSWPVSVTGTEIVNNSYGIYYTGGTGVVFAGNNITRNRAGIHIGYAFGITIADNQFWDNEQGLALEGASQITLSNNEFTNDAVTISGYDLWHYNSHTISSDNLVDGLPIDYRRDCGGVIVDGVAVGELIVANCTSVRVRNLTFDNQETAMQLAYVDDALVSFNTVENSAILLHQVGNLTFSGNLLTNASVFGGLVFDAMVTSNSLGRFMVWEGANCTVTGNVFTGPGGGLYVDRASNVNLSGNQLDDVAWGGISVWSISGLIIASNRLQNGYGLGLAYVRDGLVRGNVLSQGEFGISAWQAQDVVIEGNAIVRNNRSGLTVSAGTNVAVRDNYVALNGDYGIEVGWSVGVLVAHNEFSGNALSARDDRGAENVWDGGYPGGGNYWSNYTGLDNCSGPAQDVCPDPDGLGDTPFVIDTDTEDHYPLTTPPFGNNTPPLATLTIVPPTGTIATTFTVSADGSADAEDSLDALQVRWDWEDDGGWDTPWSAVKTAQHSYSEPATYTVRVQVRDTGGLIGEAANQLTVENTPPSASFFVLPSSGDVATSFGFDASASTDLEDPRDALQVRWDWEDDGTWDAPWSSSKTAIHSYSIVGTYSVRLEIRDTAGLTASAVRNVEVLAADLSPPEIAHTPPGDVPIGHPILILASVTDNHEVVEVYLHYRGAGEDDYASVAMTHSGGDEYYANIPAQPFAGFVAYHITATDPAGHESRSPAVAEHTVRVVESSLQPPSISSWVLPLAFGIALVSSAVALLLLRRRKDGARGK